MALKIGDLVYHVFQHMFMVVLSKTMSPTWEMRIVGSKVTYALSFECIPAQMTFAGPTVKGMYVK